MAEYAGKLVVFSSEEEVNQAIKQYEEDTIAHFVVGQKLKGFTSTELQVKRLCWYLNSSTEVKVPYDGTPFSYAGKLVMRCHHGPDKCKKQKVKYKETRLREEAAGTRKYGKPRIRKTPLKKVDCPAKISIKKVVKFPEFKLEPAKETEFGKKMMSKSVMEALQTDASAVQKEVRYYVMFAAINDHKNHEMGELAAKVEPVDDRVLNALHGYALAGVRSCTVLQNLCITFVEKKLFKDKVSPPRSRRRFYPNLSDIRNFLYKNKEELRKTQSTLNPNQLLSQFGVDVASTSTAPPSEEGIDSTGIVALMNVAVNPAVNNQYIQHDATTTFSTAAIGDATGQQSTVLRIPSSQAVPVQETIKTQAHTQVPCSSLSTVVPIETLTQTQAFTKPVVTSITQESALPELTRAPCAPELYAPLPQGALQNMHQVPTTTIPQQISIQPHPQNIVSSSDFEAVEIQINPVSSEPQDFVNSASLQHQVASTLEELARLPVHAPLVAVKQSHVAQVTKPSRLKLVLKLKDLTRQVHDYALLIKGTDNLQSLVSSLENVVEQASELAAAQPEKSRTRKRKASPLVPTSAPTVKATVQGHVSSTLSEACRENAASTVTFVSMSDSEHKLDVRLTTQSKQKRNRTYQAL